MTTSTTPRPPTPRIVENDGGSIPVSTTSSTQAAAGQGIVLNKTVVAGWLLVGAAGVGVLMTLVPWLDGGFFTANPWGLTVMGESAAWWSEDAEGIDMLGMIRVVAPVLLLGLALAGFAGVRVLRGGSGKVLAMAGAGVYTAGIVMAIIAMFANDIEVGMWAAGTWVSFIGLAAIGVGATLAKA